MHKQWSKSLDVVRTSLRNGFFHGYLSAQIVITSENFHQIIPFSFIHSSRSRSFLVFSVILCKHLPRLLALSYLHKSLCGNLWKWKVFTTRIQNIFNENKGFIYFLGLVIFSAKRMKIFWLNEGRDWQWGNFMLTGDTSAWDLYSIRSCCFLRKHLIPPSWPWFYLCHSKIPFFVCRINNLLIYMNLKKHITSWRRKKFYGSLEFQRLKVHERFKWRRIRGFWAFVLRC